MQLFFENAGLYFRKEDSSWNSLPSLPIFQYVRHSGLTDEQALPVRLESLTYTKGPQLRMLAALDPHSDSDNRRLRTVVQSALARNMYLSGRNLRFEMHADGVVLRGTVRSYYHKQLAQESLKAISGIPRIRNEIEVVCR